jgi:hypothetical protein
MGDLAAKEVAMFTVQNSIAIQLGSLAQGSAEGPLGIGALLLIVLILGWRWRQKGAPCE